MTSLESRVKNLEKMIMDQEEALHICLDLIDGLDKYCNATLKTSTPPKVQKNWDDSRIQLLKLAKEHIRGKSKKGKKRTRTRKIRR